MRAALTGLRLATCGAKNQMNGSVSNPIRAVNMRRTATLLFLKYFSTRYLSKWVEMAQRTGPEKAKASQDIDIRLKFAERLIRSAPTGRNSLGVAPVFCGEPFRSDEHLQKCAA
jgi:hypothetical protein